MKHYQVKLEVGVEELRRSYNNDKPESYYGCCQIRHCEIREKDIVKLGDKVWVKYHGGSVLIDPKHLTEC